MEEPFIVSQLFSMQKKKKTFYLALCVPVGPLKTKQLLVTENAITEVNPQLGLAPFMLISESSQRNLANIRDNRDLGAFIGAFA